VLQRPLILSRGQNSDVLPFDVSPYRSRELPEESEIFPGLIFGPIVLPCYPEADPKPTPKRPTGLRSRFFVRFWVAGSHSRPKNQPRKDFRFFRNLSRPIRSTQCIWSRVTAVCSLVDVLHQPFMCMTPTSIVISDFETSFLCAARHADRGDH
jgi:hypothetical protein